MNRPETPFEAASYDLNQFRERRIADRRFSPRSGVDRRQQDAAQDSQAASDNLVPGSENEVKPGNQ